MFTKREFIELLHKTPEKVSDYIIHNIQKKGFNKKDCFDFVFNDLSSLDLSVEDLALLLDTFDDAFYNTLEATEEYQALLSNMDSCEYYNDDVKEHLNIDVILAIMKEFKLSISEVDDYLASKKLIIYDNFSDFIKKEINMINDEELLKILNTKVQRLKVDIGFNTTILDLITKMDDDIKIIHNKLIVQLI